MFNLRSANYRTVGLAQTESFSLRLGVVSLAAVPTTAPQISCDDSIRQESDI